MPEIILDDVWIERLAWMGPTGLIVLTFVLRQLRLFIIKHRKPKVEPPTPVPDPVPDPEPDPVDAPPPEPPSVISLGVQQSSTAIVNVEDFYAKLKARREKISTGVSAALQSAIFLAVEENRPQLVTLYDPTDVKEGDSICSVEDFPYTDPRRRPTSGHPAAGELGEVVVIDTRQLPNPDHSGHMPRPFAERWKALAEQRRAAIENGSVDSPVKSVRTQIQAHAEYMRRIRQQAEIDFELLKASVREDAEKMAREVFVPKRMAELEKESTESGVPVQKVIDSFVSMVGDEAVNRMQAGGLWSFADSPEEK